MKNQNAKKYLEQVKKLDLLIENKLAEKAQWYGIATNTVGSVSGDRVQSSGNPQKMADAVGRYVDMEKDIDRAIDNFVDKKREIISVIEQLPPTEYDLLHKVYVQYKFLQDVATERGKSYGWAATVHGVALKHVQEILNANESGAESDE